MVSKPQGQQKGGATTFQKEQQQGFRFQHSREAVSLTGEVAAADYALSQFPLRGGPWDGSPAFHLVREREGGQEVVGD